MLQAQLSGRGVNSGNNQALVLVDWQTETYEKLLRTGDRAPGIPFGKVRSMQAVEVNPYGHYTVLVSVKGVPAGGNQALLIGDTQESEAAWRQPRAYVVKGGYYPGGRVKSLSLKPVSNPGGAGGRGLGQVVDSWRGCRCTSSGRTSARR